MFYKLKLINILLFTIMSKELTKCLNNLNLEYNYEKVKKYYDNVLNKDKTTFTSSNDIPTPIDCVEEIVDKIPVELWKRKDLKILDPCCGNGNFFLNVYEKLKEHHSEKCILENILHFNDINKLRLSNVRKTFEKNNYKLLISEKDYLTYNEEDKYDLIITNPPYAKLMEDNKRSSKNHNLIGLFIEKSFKLLKKNGFLVFLTPDNWMSCSDRNKLIYEITKKQIIHLNIHTAKKYFKKIGSSFTWYIIENKPFYKNINVEGIWRKEKYISSINPQEQGFIPLFFNCMVQNILNKTIIDTEIEKFKIITTSFLHKYTKKELINKEKDDIFKYKLIHTPKQTVYSKKPHKFQEGYKVFISLTDKYNVFIDECGMTQSIAFILCDNKKEAEKYKKTLTHPLYVFINNICRWGNFNNVRILQKFPIPQDFNNIYKSFNITDKEIKFIEDNL